MTRKMNLVLGFVSTALMGLSTPAYTLEMKGRPTVIYADPSDLVLGIAAPPGPCLGGTLYHIQRANVNFREATAVVLTAYATGKTLTLFIAGCSGNRHILSHVAVHDWE
jgi:hypothetical protein